MDIKQGSGYFVMLNCVVIYQYVLGMLFFRIGTIMAKKYLSVIFNDI